MQAPALLRRLSAGALALRNRVVMAPMTRNRADALGIPTPRMADYYAQRASAGLIVTEAAQISPQGVGYPHTPGIHAEAQIAAWRRITDRVHAVDGRIVLQLWHVGRVSHPAFQPGGALPVAPSAIAPRGEAHTPDGPKPFVTPRALETGEIRRIVDDFARGAENARRAGFDAVELHGANGYLIDQFLRDGTNRRTDRYGGSIANRTRFLLEAARATADAWSPDRVGVRLSPSNTFNDMSDSRPEALFTHAAAELSRLGLAYRHVVEPDPADARHGGPGWRPVPSKRLRPHYRGTLIAAGGYTPDGAARAVDAGEADAIAFGKLFIANPDLVERIRHGEPLAQADPSTFYGGGEKGYTDYPSLAALAAH